MGGRSGGWPPASLLPGWGWGWSPWAVGPWPGMAAGLRVLRRPSRPAPIAPTEDARPFGAVVHPEDGPLAVFGPNDMRPARGKTGGEPAAVVIHPDRTTAFVANRADATVVKLVNLKGTPV